MRKLVISFVIVVMIVLLSSCNLRQGGYFNRSEIHIMNDEDNTKEEMIDLYNHLYGMAIEMADTTDQPSIAYDEIEYEKYDYANLEVMTRRKGYVLFAFKLSEVSNYLHQEIIQSEELTEFENDEIQIVLNEDSIYFSLDTNTEDYFIRFILRARFSEDDNIMEVYKESNTGAEYFNFSSASGYYYTYIQNTEDSVNMTRIETDYKNTYDYLSANSSGVTTAIRYEEINLHDRTFKAYNYGANVFEGNRVENVTHSSYIAYYDLDKLPHYSFQKEYDGDITEYKSNYHISQLNDWEAVIGNTLIVNERKEELVFFDYTIGSYCFSETSTTLNEDLFSFEYKLGYLVIDDSIENIEKELSEIMDIQYIYYYDGYTFYYDRSRVSSYLTLYNELFEDLPGEYK